MYSSFEISTNSNIDKWKSSGVYDPDDATLEVVDYTETKSDGTVVVHKPRRTLASQNGKLNVRLTFCLLK